MQSHFQDQTGAHKIYVAGRLTAASPKCRQLSPGQLDFGFGLTVDYLLASSNLERAKVSKE